MSNNNKILLTGATGFVGRSVEQKLKKSGASFSTTSLSKGLDLRDKKQTESYLMREKPAVIIHAAAYIGGIKFGIDHAGEVYYNNILMTTNLIEAARKSGVKKFISPIANCAYPDIPDGRLKEDRLWDGKLHESVLPYGMVRRAQWAQTWAYQKQYGMNFVNLILPNMYGPGDYFEQDRSHALGALMMRIAEAARTGAQTVVVWGTGKPVREWLYVADGAEALVRAIDIEHPIEPVNIGVGKGISIKDLSEIIAETVGYSGKLVFDTTKPDGALHKVMDISRLKEVFGWVPETNLIDGISKTYQWYKKEFTK